MDEKDIQKKYNEIFHDLKEEKMDWDFGEFLTKAEEKSAPPIRQSPLRPNSTKYFWLAASIVLIAAVVLLLKNFAKPDENYPVQANSVKQNTTENPEILAQNTAPAIDSLKTPEKDSIAKSISADEEAEAMMNKILPKNGRMKKHSRERYAANAPKNYIKKQEKTAYRDDFVTINGHRIENEQEAIDLTKYSLQMLSQKMTQTVAKAQQAEDNTDF